MLTAGEALTRFGQQLQDLRTARALSIEQLATLAGVSSGLLSQLERGMGNPSFLTIAKIAYALQVPISTFFEMDGPADLVVRRDRRKRLLVPGLSEQGLIYELLTPDLTRALEMLWVEMPAGQSIEERPFEHQGEECSIVLEGTLEIHLGDRTYRLEAGDSIAYRSSTPHWYRNPGPITTKSVWAITPPSF